MSRAIVAGDINRIEGGLFAGGDQAKVPAGYYQFAQGIGEVDQPFDSQNSEILALGDYYALSGDGIGKAKIVNQTILANFIVGLTPRSNPTARYRVNGPVLLSDALMEAAAAHGDGETIAVVGLVEFTELHGSRRGKTLSVGKRQAIFFGLVDARPGKLSGEVGQVFDQDRRDSSSEDMNVMLTYGLFPNRSRPDLQDLNSTVVKLNDVGRLFSQSVMESGELWIYEVEVQSPR
ncbi:MAG: hypothetical protein RLY93_19555 [Sumerlaeia bacterium]